jgi:macrolide-specific efflux system membrane fusion protein
MVVRVTAGEQTTTRVQTGLAGDDDTIVADGLSAGDEVVETSASALAGAQAATQPATATSANPATPSFGGGFRRGGGPPSFR